jgi:hypothetical protein
MTQELDLLTRRVGPWEVNAYVLVCPETREYVITDPGADADAPIAMLAGARRLPNDTSRIAPRSMAGCCLRSHSRRSMTTPSPTHGSTPGAKCSL